MPASLHASLITAAQRLVRGLPAPLLRALDAWSLRVARRRALQRQIAWQQQKARAAATVPVTTRAS